MLLVEDDPFLRHALEHCMRRLSAEPTAVSSCDAAESALAREPPFAAALIDIHLDGLPTGLELAAAIRASGSPTRCMLMTADASARLVNQAQMLGVEILLKPFDPAHLETFLDRARAQAHPFASPLTPVEREIVGLARRGASRREMADSLGISENTVKTHTKRVLAKTGDSSLAVLVARLDSRS